MAEENNNLAPPVPAHKSTDAAFEQIHRANQFVRVITIIALVVMVALLGFALVRVNQIAEAQRAEATERAARNRQILEELQKSSRDTQVLICNIINIQSPTQVRPPEVTAQIDKICGPVLSDGPSAASEGTTSFLDRGGSPTITLSQPATGGGTPPLDNTTSQPQGTGSGDEPPKQTPPPQQPGLVETINPQVSEVLCSPQQLLLNGCIIR